MSRTLDERLADLTVRAGANVQRGQTLVVSAEPDHLPLVREIARVAYERGARFVDLAIFDPELKAVRLLHVADEDLDHIPPWLGAAVLAQGEDRAATIRVTGATRPLLLDDIDPARSGRDMLPMVPERRTVINDRSINWSLIPYPTAGWAEKVYPHAPDALDRLSAAIEHVCRLDAPDPVRAWRERLDDLTAVGARLTEHRFHAIRFRGPGTDLTVGLLPASRWITTEMRTYDGVTHMANLPTEELLTAPDPARVDGVVTATRPLVLGGSVIEGLKVRFENGAAVEATADRGAEVLEGYLRRDDGACRLGELALVDGQGRIGPLNTLFYETLLDENAASHLAFGWAYAAALDEGAGDAGNVSAIHIDFMIGSEETEVDGIARGGESTPVLRSGQWCI